MQSSDARTVHHPSIHGHGAAAGLTRVRGRRPAHPHAHGPYYRFCPGRPLRALVATPRFAPSFLVSRACTRAHPCAYARACGHGKNPRRRPCPHHVPRPHALDRSSLAMVPCPGRLSPRSLPLARFCHLSFRSSESLLPPLCDWIHSIGLSGSGRCLDAL